MPFYGATKKQPKGAPLMTRVRSSNVRSIGYDFDAEILYVMFLNKKDKRKLGAFYRYLNVKRSVFVKMKGSPSKGRFVHNILRGPDDNKYAYQKWTGHAWRIPTVLQRKKIKAKKKRSEVRRSKMAKGVVARMRAARKKKK